MKGLIKLRDGAGEVYLIATSNIQRVEALPKDKQTDHQRVAVLVLEPVSAGADGLGVVYELNHYYSGLSLTTFEGAYA